MKSLSAAQTQHILFLLDSGKSGEQISASTGGGTATISILCSKHCSSLQKSLGGHCGVYSPFTGEILVEVITSI